jgi:hypothetical protein
VAFSTISIDYLLVVLNVPKAAIRLERGEEPVLLTIVHHDDEWAAVQPLPLLRTANKRDTPTVVAKVSENPAPVVINDAVQTVEILVEGSTWRPLLFSYDVLKILGDAHIDRVARADDGSPDAQTGYFALSRNVDAASERSGDHVLTDWPERI